MRFMAVVVRNLADGGYYLISLISMPATGLIEHFFMNYHNYSAKVLKFSRMREFLWIIFQI